MRRLSFIKHSRDLGFEVDAIRELLEMSSHPERPCAEVDLIARRHLVEVERRIDQLTALRGELNRMLADCGQGHVGECRVIYTLSNHARCANERH